jgi:hypothetical protein
MKCSRADANGGRVAIFLGVAANHEPDQGGNP